MGDLIAGMRQYAKLGVDELAGQVGMSSRTLQRLEANDRKTVVKREVLEKIVTDEKFQLERELNHLERSA